MNVMFSVFSISRLRLGLVLIAGLMALTGPAGAQDRMWSNLTGRVVSCQNDVMSLNFGGGQITVAMPNLTWCDGGRDTVEGMTVTAYGYVRGTPRTARRFDAVGIFVHDDHTVYAGARTDRIIGQTIYADPMAIRDGNPVNVLGRIIRIAGEEFQIDTGSATVPGDTGKMPYNPFEAGQLPAVRVGDFVIIKGRMDTGPFRRYEVQAESMVRMMPAS